MKYPFYEMTIPVFIRSLQNLSKLLNKGKRHASRKKMAMSTLLQSRLAPDMYNLIQQVQYAYFMALETATNLSGLPMPKDFKYDERTLVDLNRSIKKTIKFLRTIKRGTYATSSQKKIQTFLNPKKKFNLDFYVNMLALPNLFFHVATAYDILRHRGVPLKKDDYLGI